MPLILLMFSGVSLLGKPLKTGLKYWDKLWINLCLTVSLSLNFHFFKVFLKNNFFSIFPRFLVEYFSLAFVEKSEQNNRKFLFVRDKYYKSGKAFNRKNLPKAQSPKDFLYFSTNFYPEFSTIEMWKMWKTHNVEKLWEYPRKTFGKFFSFGSPL